MERGSDKHGSRLDDEMEREVRGEMLGVPGGRVEEWDGEDQPQPTELLDDSEQEQFSRFGRYIGLSALPGDRAALRRSAETLNAPDDILAELDRLPPGETFDTVAAIWRALGHQLR